MNTRKSFGLLLLLALATCGCAGVGEKSSPEEVKAFFAAANEANYLGVMCMSPQHIDLSGYTSFMGVKYPPTDRVEVLSEPPSRSYQAFALLQGPAASGSLQTGDASPLLTQLTAKARAIGADAIIICRRQDGPGPVGSDRPVKMEAVAIKYRLENPAEKQGRP